MDTDTVQQVVPLYSLSGTHSVKPIPQAKSCIVKSLLDIEKFDSLNDFNVELQKYRTDTRKKSQNKKQKLETKDGKGHAHSPILPSSYLPEEVIHSALEKCLRSKSFWSKDVFDSLLESGYFAPGLHTVIVECIIMYESFSSLQILSRSGPVVAEKHIVKLLKSVVAAMPASVIQALHSKLCTTECPIDADIALNLSYIMLLPFDKVSLREYLKLLSLDEALVLLQFLHHSVWTRSPAVYRDPALAKSEPYDEGLTEAKVVFWLDLVLTAKLMGFITSPTLSLLLKGLQKTVTRQKLFYKEVSSVGACLRLLESMEGKKGPDLIRRYQIETITL